jgi:phospholipid/cholesterol/gamma-HCH transport system permease protein
VNFVGQIGERVIAKWHRLRHLLATATAVVATVLHPSHWRNTVRDVLARQILFPGVDATRFVAVIAMMVGVSVVVQAQVWLGKVGKTDLLGPLLITVIVRELAPLLTNFVIIGRSGTAVATELGSMKVSGEVMVLDAQGLDPFQYLVVPRVLGMAVSVFCLTIIFVVVSLVGGYLVGLAVGATSMEPLRFADTVLAGLSQADVWSLLVKSLVPGLLTGSICCTEGLSVVSSITEVPQAATRAVVRSTTALFITSALVDVVTYL